MMKKMIRKTGAFKALRAEAQGIVAAYADGADFVYTVSRLAAIGEKMEMMLS